MSAPAPVLPADLTAGLRRLKLDAMRQLAPELLLTAKTQRWAPEEVLRTLIEAEIASGTPPTPGPALKLRRSRSSRPSRSSTCPPRASQRPPGTTSRRWNGSARKRTWP